MLRKTFNKFAEKTFVNKTKAHAIQPKAINLHFPNAINPEFKFLNLTNLSSISFNIRTIKKELEKDEFALSAQITAHSDNHVKNMDIAVFKSEEEANTALNDIRVALYMPSKSFAKWVAILAVVCGVVCMGHIHMKGMMHNTQDTSMSVQEVSNVTPTATPVGLPMNPMGGNMGQSDIPAPVDNGEIDKIISQLQEVKQLQGGMNPQQDMQQAQPQEPEQQQSPTKPLEPAEQLLNGLN